MLHDVVIPQDGEQYRAFIASKYGLNPNQSQRAAADHDVYGRALRHGCYMKATQHAAETQVSGVVLQLGYNDRGGPNSFGRDGLLWFIMENASKICMRVPRGDPAANELITTIFNLAPDQLPVAADAEIEYEDAMLFMQHLHDFEHAIYAVTEAPVKIAGEWRMGRCNWAAGLRTLELLPASWDNLRKLLAEVTEVEAWTRHTRREQAEAAFPWLWFQGEGTDSRIVKAIDAGARLLPILNNDYGIMSATLKKLRKHGNFMQGGQLKIDALRGVRGDRMQDTDRGLLAIRDLAYAGLPIALINGVEATLRRNDIGPLLMTLDGIIERLEKRHGAVRTYSEVGQRLLDKVGPGGLKHWIEAGLKSRIKRDEAYRAAHTSLEELDVSVPLSNLISLRAAFAVAGWQFNIVSNGRQFARILSDIGDIAENLIIEVRSGEQYAWGNHVSLASDLTFKAGRSIVAGLQDPIRRKGVQEMFSALLDDPNVRQELQALVNHPDTLEFVNRTTAIRLRLKAELSAAFSNTPRVLFNCGTDQEVYDLLAE